MKDSVNIIIQLQDGSQKTVEAPLGVSISLMEVLKAYGEPIEATCGGIALCATCHIEVLSDFSNEQSDEELDMLETLPNFTQRSRLSCQMPITADMDGMVIRLLSEVTVY